MPLPVWMAEANIKTRPPADVTGCNCENDLEHFELVQRVNRSFELDYKRATERNSLTSSFLRDRHRHDAD
jgi:hypothetical protein